MQTYTVVVLDRDERSKIGAVATSLTIAYPDGDDVRTLPEPRAVRALGTAGGIDATHELLSRAREAVGRQAEVCERESHIEHWTHTLSATGEPITKDTPGDGLVTQPYFACQYLAEARTTQFREATEALEVIDTAMRYTTPRPLSLKYAGC